MSVLLLLLYKREAIWGKLHLSVACEALLETRRQAGHHFVPGNGPTSNCEMRLAPDGFLLILKRRIVQFSVAPVMCED